MQRVRNTRAKALIIGFAAVAMCAALFCVNRSSEVRQVEAAASGISDLEAATDPEVLRHRRQAVNNFLRAKPRTVVDLLHRWRVDATVFGNWTGNLDLRSQMMTVLSLPEFRRKFPESDGLMVRSTSGWQVRSRLQAAGKEEWQFEAHIDQMLATCAEVGVPGDQVVDMGKEQCTILDLVQTSRRSYVVDQESAWSVVAYCHYLPEEPSWQNRFGEWHSYQSIAERLIMSKADEGPCNGTHKQYALALMLRADKRRRMFSRDVRSRVQTYLRNSTSHLVKSQNASGSWPSHWVDERAPGGGHGDGSRSLDRMIQVTAHHIEWALIAERDLRPGDEALTKAAQFLTVALQYNGPEEIVKNYCGYSHAARVIALFMGQDRTTTGDATLP